MNLLETLTQSVPNAGPKAQALFNDAEQKLQMLESSGSSRAGVIRQQLADAISKGQNPSGLIKGLDKIYYSSLSRAEKGLASTSPARKEAKGVAPEEALAQIENALNMGDERGIKLSDQEIKSAASFIEKGDLKGASKVAGKLTQRIEEAIKLQNEEEKETRTTQDGTQFSVGKKTGTIYSGGVPVSRGMQNTDSFNLFTGSKAVSTTPFVGQIEVALPEKTTKFVSQLETVQPQPELYGQQTEPEQMSALREKEAAFNEARALYYSGRNNEALSLINAAGGKGMLGGDYTPDDLERVFGQKLQQPPANQTAPQRPPLSELIPTR